MKGKVLLSSMILAAVCSAMLSSCGSAYKEQPFGGMNGKVQTAKVWHIMPEVWHANNRGTDVMEINTSVYDIYGNEIYSAGLGSAQRIKTEAENMFENSVCTRSTLRSGGRVVAKISLISNDKGRLEYNKEVNGRIVRMTVKQTSFLRRHKSVVTEDGKVTTVRVIKTDADGYPVRITTTEPQTGRKILVTNIFDENHNVIETRMHTNIGEDGKEEDQIIYSKYEEVDEHGNWTNCRTFNKHHLPVEVLVRELEYWE